MAGSDSKGNCSEVSLGAKRAQSAEEREAAELIYHCFQPVSLLQDFGENLPRCGLHPTTVKHAILHIVNDLDPKLSRVLKLLPAKHPARAEIVNAESAAHACVDTVFNAIETDEWGRGPDSLGEALQALAMRATISLERGELAVELNRFAVVV